MEDKDTLIDHNIYNPEAETHPHTVVIPLKMSIKDHLRARDDEGYNLGRQVLTRLINEYESRFSDNNLENDLGSIAVGSIPEPGMITGDIKKDSLLIPIYAMDKCEDMKGFAFRWFTDDGQKYLTGDKRTKNPGKITDNLNTHGVEMSPDQRPNDGDYLSSDDPFFLELLRLEKRGHKKQLPTYFPFRRNTKGGHRQVCSYASV